jgi:hypothetical protein
MGPFFRALGYAGGPLPPRRDPFKGMESFRGDDIRGVARASTASATEEHGTD